MKGNAGQVIPLGPRTVFIDEHAVQSHAIACNEGAEASRRVYRCRGTAMMPLN